MIQTTESETIRYASPNLCLTSQFTISSALYSDLLTRIEKHLTIRNIDQCTCKTLPNCTPDQYPDVKYWTPADWTNAKANNGFRGLTSDSRMCGYMEDQSGRPIDITTIEHVRDCCRSIWNHFLVIGRAPLKWSEVGIEEKVFFFHVVYRFYPFMALAMNHWKANQVATDYYPSWISSSGRKERASNAQQSPNLTNLLRKLQIVESEMPSMKRSASEEPDVRPAAKKVKKENKVKKEERTVVKPSKTVTSKKLVHLFL